MQIYPLKSLETLKGSRKDIKDVVRKGILKIALLDLNHTTTGLHTCTMPLGIGLLGAYLLEKLPKGSIEVNLYKFSDDLAADLVKKFDVVGFSMYSWNTNLNRHYAERMKEINPSAIVVCGGPNITYQNEWIKSFLIENSFVDYLVPFNGEMPLLSIVESELFGDKRERQNVRGAYYLEGDEHDVVFNELPAKLESLDSAPSPYLTGLMDKFFPTPQSPHKLAPFVETNRGCPYQCTFCHTANKTYNKLIYKDNGILGGELALFAERMKEFPDIPLYIADNNFGMFNRDNEIADIIRTYQDSSGWPVFIDVTVGKSRVENILQVVKKLKPGTLSVFMSAQSMTPQVLKNIKRKNLSPEDFQYLQHGLSESTKGESSALKNLSSSGIIIGLPGETRQSFFESVEKIMDMGINSFIPYTLMVLKGTPLGDEIYERRSEYVVKQRIVPQQFGKYEGRLILDTEEVAVGTPTMSYNDYLECRALCFFLQVVYGNDLFQSHIQLLRKHSCSVFSWILDIMATVRKDKGKLGQLFQSFYADTEGELWDSEGDLSAFFESEQNYNDLLEGKYGANLMTKYTFLSRMECFDEWVDVVFRVSQDTLLKHVTNEDVQKEAIDFLGEYKEYCLQVKNIASFFEDKFEPAPFTMRLRYNFDDADPLSILNSRKEMANVTFSFSDTAKSIIANIKRDTNWSYKLKHLIRMKNGAESLYPRTSQLLDNSANIELGHETAEYATSKVAGETRDQSWRL
jgi:radical SAM superfamily enzyme YgiQ (UPF0313 family)